MSESPYHFGRYENGAWIAVADDKNIIVTGDCELNIRVDFDDVNHQNVKLQVRALIDTLANHYPKPAPEVPWEPDDEDED